MPAASHPQAKFDPISPDLDLRSLVDEVPNLKWAQRVSISQLRSLGPQEFEKLVLMHVINGGKPLVIEGFDAVLPKWLFSSEWLEKKYDKKEERVRDIVSQSDIPMTTGHYLRSMKQLTNQWTPTNFRDDRRQRLYLKDIDCPPEWQEALQKIVNPVLFYLNSTITRTGAISATENEPQNPKSDAASAGDLMSSLPQEMRAENLMCYIGHEGTYTPAHREMCASLGQNIMVETSGDANGEKPGSSIWFMTESKDRAVVREYFLSMLGHDIEIEKHFAQVNAWKKAPFDVYVVEQRVGDFILVPPLAAHQVWNRGTRTMKVAWNRTTVETLELALQEALPKARLVCRDEQYKNKAMIYYTLQIYHHRLQSLDDHIQKTRRDDIRNSFRAKQLASDFKKLFILFTKILVDEVFLFREREVEFVPFDSCITCSYCRGNIFNRFLTCRKCVRTLINGDEDTYDVCMECYAMGRSCGCLSGLQWCEQWHWSELVENHETWRSMIISNDGFIDVDISPQPLEVVKRLSGKKSVAQICQEALRQRPWKDITQTEKDLAPSESEEGEGGEQSKSKKKRTRKKKMGNVRRCHVCCHKELVYRMQMCSNPDCLEGYCFGVLYRAFDMMPQEVLQDENWQCPKCLGICNCGYCRRTGTTNPYTPKNTSLGHDTRAVADDRSVEALVDFRLHNLAWLKAAGEKSRGQDTKRMRRLREQADTAKAEGEDAEDAEDAEADPTAENSAHDSSHHERPTQIAGGNSDQQGAEPAGFAQPSLSQQAAEPSQLSAPWLINGDQAMNGQDGDDSLYPDPPVLAAQRIGMGYYEQDDSPDKILFDPYQAPTAEDLREEEADIPEFVKKSIRSAKRKAKKENEDPEFIIKSHSRKRPKASREHDFLDSMDPALFSEAPAASAPQEAAPENGAGNSEDMTLVQPGSEEPKRKEIPRYDANEPLLRHAKPKASYVELEELELEELNENEHVNTLLALASGKSSPEPTMDTVPRGEADDDNATMEKDESSAQVGPQSSAPTGQKRRGRPPAHSKGPSSVSLETRPTRAEVTEKTKATGDTRRRGVGRPRRSGPGVASNRVRAEEEGDDEPAPTANRPRRGRGRPRASEPSRSPAPKRAGNAGQQFMSLKERMALRGKSVKIAKRGRDDASSPDSPKKLGSMTVQLPGFTAVNKPSLIHRQSFEHVDENMGTSSRQKSDVNIGYAGETGGSGGDSGSSDDDIPARINRSGSTSRPISIALRGRGRPRGRPSMRSRGRGRP